MTSARYEIINCEQGSPEWHDARRGIPTASRFKDVMAQGEGKMRARYMRELAAEQIMKEPVKGYTNAHMDRGKDYEAELLAKYCYDKDVNVEKVGFLRSTLMSTGCSPDGLVLENGMVEIKSTLPELLVEILERGRLPTGHQPQVQGQLWISGRQWCDIVFGWPKMPLFIHRVERDEPYMAGLRAELISFNEELGQLVKRLEAL
jgi:hypothetical protein